MNTHDHKHSHRHSHPTSKVKAGPIIGGIVALALIIAASVTQTNAKPFGAVDITVPPIASTDHIRGPITAPVQVIEYSDLECPFCKDFHATMQQLFAEYGPKNEIVWAYRHFPLDALHKKARTEAIAVECAAKIGGDAAFWKMTDTIFERTTSNDGLDLNTLPLLAQESGVARTAFLKCFNAKETLPKVEADIAGGAAAGAQGTPYTVVVSPKGNTFLIGGALPYAESKEIIDRALADK